MIMNMMTMVIRTPTMLPTETLPCCKCYKCGKPRNTKRVVWLRTEEGRVRLFPPYATRSAQEDTKRRTTMPIITNNNYDDDDGDYEYSEYDAESAKGEINKITTKFQLLNVSAQTALKKFHIEWLSLVVHKETLNALKRALFPLSS